MPEPALPIPPDPALRGMHPVHRQYRDLLRRPLSGNLQLQGQFVRLTVAVTDGVLNLMLPAGDYVLAGTLWTVEDGQTPISEAFTVGEGGVNMGGKPNPGTKKDRRLKGNKKKSRR